MKNKTSIGVITPFEQIRKTDDKGNEYWWAKDLSRLLGYDKHSEFLAAIDRAKTACAKSGYAVEDHFQEASDIRTAGEGVRRKFASVRLSRYACYLAIMNGDPAKEAVAMGQTYLIAQSRARELEAAGQEDKQKGEMEKRIYLRKELAKQNLALSSLARKAGVITPNDFAIFQNHGYMGLYGGLDARDIRISKGLPKEENILDHMGSDELSANLYRVTQAQERLVRQTEKGASQASRAHFEAGEHARQAIKQLGGSLPEELPAAPDIHNIEKGKIAKGKRKS